MKQLAIDMPPAEPSYAPQDFCVSAANQTAYDMVMQWPDWPGPYPARCFYGPKGCGKTHLSHVWAERAGARQVDILTLGAVPSHILLAEAKAVLIDDMDQLPKASEDALFHLTQYCLTERIAILVTSRQPLSRLSIQLPDLRSRLALIPAYAMYEPDDELLMALLGKQFADRQLRVRPDVLSYAVRRIDRSFAAVQAFVEALDQASLTQNRPITLPFAKQCLS